MPTTLMDELASIDQDHRVTDASIRARAASIIEAIDEIREQFTELSRQSEALIQQAGSLAQDSEANRQARTKESAGYVASHLRGQAAELERWNKAATNRARIARVKEDDPEIATKHQEYQEFGANLDRNLASVPEFYRESMLKTHARLGAEVAHYADLLAQAMALGDAPKPKIDAPTHVSPDGELTVVLPLSAQNAPDDPTVAALVEANTRWIKSLAQRLGIELVEIAPGPWRHWHAISALLAPEDALVLANALSKDKSNRSVHAPFKLGSIDLLLAPLDDATWAHLGSEHDDVSQGTPEPEAEPMPLEPHFEGNAWFTTEQWLAWQNAAKRGRGRRWRQEGLALQSLLTRMVAKGTIGDHHVSLKGASDGLPEDDARALRGLFGRTRQMGIIHAIKSDAAQIYAINPERLDDVRDLINGRVTETWKAILAQA